MLLKLILFVCVFEKDFASLMLENHIACLYVCLKMILFFLCLKVISFVCRLKHDFVCLGVRK